MLRADAQRDVDRRDDVARAVRSASTTARSSSSTPPRPQVDCLVTGRGRRLLLRPPEVLRLRRRALARRLLAGRGRAHRADLGLEAVDPRLARSHDRARRTAGSNQTYNTPALATLFLLDQQLQWMLEPRRAGVVRTSRCRGLGRGALRLGRVTPVGDAVRHRPGEAFRRRRHDRPRRRRRQRRSTPCCEPTASSTPTPTASSAATSSGSACSRPSTRRRRRPDPLHRPRRRPPLASGRLAGE